MGVNGIYGLSGSGLDIESMVKVGMMSKQNEYDKMQQNYTLNEWKKEAYLDVYNKIQTYSTSTISQYKLQSNMNSRTATSSNAAITATATSAAPVMAHTLTVNQTATNAYLIGTEKLTQSLQTTAGGATSISFKLYDTMGTASSVSFEGANNTNAKFDANLMKNALLTTLAPTDETATSISQVSSIGSDKVGFLVTSYKDDNGTVTKNDTLVTKEASDTALSFTVNNSDVKVTYGELAKLLSEPTYEFEFSDFISLLNQKMESLGVTASHSEAGNGALTFTNNQEGGTVSVKMNDTGIGATLRSLMGSNNTITFSGNSSQKFDNSLMTNALLAGVNLNYDNPTMGNISVDGNNIKFGLNITGNNNNNNSFSGTVSKTGTETALSFTINGENLSLSYNDLNDNTYNVFSNVSNLAAVLNKAMASSGNNLSGVTANIDTDDKLTFSKSNDESVTASLNNTGIAAQFITKGTDGSLTVNSDSSAKLAQYLLKDAINTNDVTITGIDTTTNTDNVSFTLKIGGGDNGFTGTITKTASDTALAFNVNNSAVNFSYSNIASNMTSSGTSVDPDYQFNFSSFVSSLNTSMSNNNSSVTAEYSGTGNGALTFTASTGTVDVSLSGEIESYISSNIDKNSLSEKTNNNSATLGTSKDVSLKVTAGTTYNDLAKAINNAGTNVRATFDATNNLFSIYNKDSGEKNIIGIDIGTDTNAQNIFNAMRLKQSAGNTSSSSTLTFDTSSKSSAVYTGKDASVLIDGTEVTNASNKITKNGVIYDITNVTSKTTATVNVTQDVDKIVDNVKSFVESYNTLLSDLYEMYNEKPNSSYKPLTDAQKNEMTEEQIEKWEKKAKAGMLYHDSTIRKLIDNMRTAVSEKVTSVGSKYDNSYSIGISTTGIYGQLTLDEDKLRTALTADPDSVSNVFTTLDSSLTRTDREKQTYFKEEGIAQRLGDIMNSSVKMITDVAGTSNDNSDDSTLSTLLRNLQSRMSSFRSMMDAFETKLYKKYDAMESSLAMLGSQLNYVTSSFGG